MEEQKVCSMCGKPMKIRQGKKGEFWGCSGYPTCTNTVNITGDKERQTAVARFNKPLDDEKWDTIGEKKTRCALAVAMITKGAIPNADAKKQLDKWTEYVLLKEEKEEEMPQPDF